MTQQVKHLNRMNSNKFPRFRVVKKAPKYSEEKNRSAEVEARRCDKVRRCCQEDRATLRELVSEPPVDELEISLDEAASLGYLMSFMYSETAFPASFSPADCTAHEALANWSLLREEDKYFDSLPDDDDEVVDLTRFDGRHILRADIRQSAVCLGTGFHPIPPEEM